jgi:hypothetical protein
MQESIRTNTAGTVNIVLLVQRIDCLIIQVESTGLVQTKSKGMIHLKNDVGTSVAWPKCAIWVKRGKWDQVKYKGICKYQICAMNLASIALARVCRKGRRPQFMGLQSGYRAGDCWCNFTFRVGCENIRGEIDRAADGSGRLCYGSWSRGGVFKNCSSSLVSHIHRSCESGPGKVGVDNVHHEPFKDKDDAVNINVRDDGCVNGKTDRGFNLALVGR